MKIQNNNSLDLEKEYLNENIKLIAGCDEAGRGPLAGPVVCAAVILPNGYSNPLINDSKKLSEKKREALFDIVIKDALAYSIISMEPEEIDRINIYEASRLGMYKAILNLNIKPDFVLTDAMPIPQSINIAAASILAKVTRDRIMKEIDAKYPEYQFSRHKGYPTKLHIELLNQYGPVKGLYRYSYGPVRDALEEQIKII